MKDKDIYLYIGHGAGEKYLNSNELKRFVKINSSIFLIGCSSVK